MKTTDVKLSKQQERVIKGLKYGHSMHQSCLTNCTYLNGETINISTIKSLYNLKLIRRGKMVGTDYEVELTDLGKSIEL